MSNLGAEINEIYWQSTVFLQRYDVQSAPPAPLLYGYNPKEITGLIDSNNLVSRVPGKIYGSDHNTVTYLQI